MFSPLCFVCRAIRLMATERGKSHSILPQKPKDKHKQVVNDEGEIAGRLFFTKRLIIDEMSTVSGDTACYNVANSVELYMQPEETSNLRIEFSSSTSMFLWFTERIQHLNFQIYPEQNAEGETFHEYAAL
ncbi:hypothetical protein SDC9_92628 [bioreactor metagenome]|uniref:Uncharacterized protein n=1 Tax=bioreactor metagenome TaxID=1076179 RepID=A0A644ZYY5_9ZZZZ